MCTCISFRAATLWPATLWASARLIMVSAAATANLTLIRPRNATYRISDPVRSCPLRPQRLPTIDQSNDTGLRPDLSNLFSFHRGGTRAPRRTLGAGAQRTNIDSKLLHGPAQRVPVHTQLPRCLALIAAVFLEHGHNKILLELADRFGVEDVAPVHLKNECFQLIFQLLPRFRTLTI